MTTLLSTLGFTPDKLLPAVVQAGGVEKLIIYHAPGETPAKDRKARDALARVLTSLRDSRIAIHPRKLPHPWRVPEMLAAMLDDIGREGPGNCFFNLTGGTKAMAVAATLACLLTGTRVLYVPEESPSPRPIPLPLPPISTWSTLTDRSIRLLRLLADRDFATQSELVKALRRSQATVSHHVARLRALKLVGDAEGGGLALTETGRLVLLLPEPLLRSSSGLGRRRNLHRRSL